MSKKIKRNVRLSLELLEILKELSDIMKTDIAGQGIEFLAFQKFNPNALLENSVMRGIQHYIDLTKNICEIHQFNECGQRIKRLQERLNNYIKNIAYYNKSPNTQVQAVKIDSKIKESIECLSEANSICMGIEINYNDIFKSCIIKGIYYVIDESKKLFQRFQQKFPDLNDITFDFERIKEILREKDTTLSSLEKTLLVKVKHEDQKEQKRTREIIQRER